MEDSKIRKRAYILHEISKLRQLSNISDSDVEAAITQLSKIDDRTFLCTTILKEINGSIVYFDGVLALLAINLARDVLEKCIFTFLEKLTVSDEKKLFLINVLNQAGIPVDMNIMHSFIENPDRAVDIETEKFLKLAEVNPEAQIDFLDFYFGINEDDRAVLLDTIIKDYASDHLANILIPLIYSVTDAAALKICIEGLLKSKSYLSFAPLEWLIQSSCNQSVVSLSRKIKNELKMAGLRKNITTLEYYKNLFKTSRPMEFLVSSIDGESNFSLIFARSYDNGAISTFFAVFNLETGPVSCFGFSNITKAEYDKIVLRFFKDSEKIPLDFHFAKSLIDEFIDFALKNKTYVPYELLCWRQLTYDIEPLDISAEEYIKNNLVPFNLSAADLKHATGSEYTSKWFFNYSMKYPEITALIDKICTLKEKDFENFDKITSDFILNFKDTMIYKVLKKRFLYQSFFFKSLGFKNLTSLFSSIYLDDELLKEFFEFSIKRSIYEFFLKLQSIKESNDKRNIFMKENKFFDFNSKKMLELIEKKWTN